MIRRPLLAALARRPLSTTPITAFGSRTMASSTSSAPASSSSSQTPMEDIMRSKLTQTFTPTTLAIHNDSHLHSHHTAMAGVTSKETHFRVVITSEMFKGKMQAARHRMVYKCLADELAMEGGVHALQLRTKTGEEEERDRVREEKEREGGVAAEGVSVEKAQG